MCKDAFARTVTCTGFTVETIINLTQVTTRPKPLTDTLEDPQVKESRGVLV